MLPPIQDHWALFLDFDGTLAEIVEDPEAVEVDARTRDAVMGLATRLDGAVAVVSGRSIETLDRFLHPLTLPSAGLHGLERRRPDGRIVRPGVTEAIETLRGRLAGPVKRAGLDLEDKGLALVVHYRRRPELEPEAHRIVDEAMAGLDGLHAVRGKMVIEVKPDTSDKGEAVRVFMAAPPFEGRVPVFVGDDVTDEDGFRAAQALGGLGVKVGEGETLARHRAASVTEIALWLRGLQP